MCVLLCRQGCGVLSSSMLHGMVFKKEAEGDITSVKDAKIAVYSCPFDCTVTETKVSHAGVSSRHRRVPPRAACAIKVRLSRRVRC